MKKWMILALLLTLLCLSGCGECVHQWTDATCDVPKTCSLCGVTEGQALGHQYRAPDCTNGKICTVCNFMAADPLGHQWIDADCTTAKTCSVCAATEGEPKGHNLLAANYQQSAVCTACGYTEGEPLKPLFAGYPVNVVEAKIGEVYDYVAECYIKGHTTVGKLTFENYQVFTSDDTHEAVEGYEWHSVQVKIVFSDKDAQRYGFMVQTAVADYFWDGFVEEGNGYTDPFVVDFNGKLYDQCLMANGYGSVSEWVDNACTYTTSFAWRVPVGYDGHLILFYNATIDLGEGLEQGDASILVFRFTE